jgi:tetratricopeptide (TPR) repeat protein
MRGLLETTRLPLGDSSCEPLYSVDETDCLSLACQRGDYREAQRLAEQKLAQTTDERATMEALHLLGVIALRTEQLEQASHYWEIALSLATERRDKQSAVCYLESLAVAASIKGNYLQADQCHQEALALERDEGLWLHVV